MTTSRPSLPRAGALLLAILLSAAIPSIVMAHAEIVDAMPDDGATVIGTPPILAATFSEPLIGDSSLSIRDGSGARLAVGGIDPADATRLIIDPVPELPAGTYEMRWSAFTDDGHLEKGTWAFTVQAAQPSSPPPTPVASDAPAPVEASDSPSIEPSVVPSPTPGPTDPGASDGAEVILPILVALAVVAAAGGLLLGRRGRTGPPT